MEFTFGKHKGSSFDEVFNKDTNYIKWVITQPYLKEEEVKYLQNLIKTKTPEYLMPWGKYKNKTLSYIDNEDSWYLSWLKNNEIAKKNNQLMEELKKYV